MADMKKIGQMLKKKREVIYQEYLNELEGSETITTKARELIDELQEIDQHLAMAK